MKKLIFILFLLGSPIPSQSQISDLTSDITSQRALRQSHVLPRETVPILKYREMNRRANRLALAAIPVALIQSQWRDGRIMNPYPLLPADIRYRPQRYFYYPTYVGPSGANGFLNVFNRTRYQGNYNGRGPVYNAWNRPLVGNPPLNWIFGF
jgi:hypothetical protein